MDLDFLFLSFQFVMCLIWFKFNCGNWIFILRNLYYMYLICIQAYALLCRFKIGFFFMYVTKCYLWAYAFLCHNKNLGIAWSMWFVFELWIFFDAGNAMHFYAIFVTFFLIKAYFLCKTFLQSVNDWKALFNSVLSPFSGVYGKMALFCKLSWSRINKPD